MLGCILHQQPISGAQLPFFDMVRASVPNANSAQVLPEKISALPRSKRTTSDCSGLTEKVANMEQSICQLPRQKPPGNPVSETRMRLASSRKSMLSCQSPYWWKDLPSLSKKSECRIAVVSSQCQVLDITEQAHRSGESVWNRTRKGQIRSHNSSKFHLVNTGNISLKAAVRPLIMYASKY